MESAMDLLGMKIVPHPLVPSRVSNFKLSPDVPLTDEARARHQAWLDDFFGTHAVAYIIDPVIACIVSMDGREIAFMNSEAITRLRLF